MFGSYVACLQCGHELSDNEESDVDAPSVTLVGEDVEAVLAMRHESPIHHRRAWG